MNTDTLELEKNLGESPASDFPRVIRRDLPQARSAKPRLVPWLGHKIEKAVDLACVAVEHPPVGKQIQAEVEFRMKKERPLFIHIEQLQDYVESLLIELGYGHVALAYGKYRARRAALREIEGGIALAGGTEQLELASPTLTADLRERLSFARIGLNLTLSESELIARLMRSVSLSLTPQEQRETIILNAKNLLDVDADSRFLAGRILLTYIYEETLPWKISDGIDQLKEAHRKAFLKYIPLGIEIKRLDPRLAEFHLKELADAIDPYADLHFDFIGVQNLYDRDRSHRQDADAPEGRRRIEAPQMFWMRVAMGLA
ncbi:MAG TPA: ATP cone domain-containing protein, partial [Candidatus Methylacidiphilales bacterium]